MDDGRDKPPVTLVVMTYNQVRFVAPAVESALAQDYDGPLEIIITDDASTDGTAEELQRLVAGHAGRHRVRLNVNSRNLGLIAHLHKAFAMARHDLVVFAAGDDISRRDRVRRLADLHARTGAWLLHSGFHFIDPQGAKLRHPDIPTTFATAWTLQDVARSRGLFVGATAAYHKGLLRTFGPILERGAYEDLVMGFRAALLGRIARHDGRLVSYRLGTGISMTAGPEGSKHEHELSVLLAVYRQRLTDAKGFGLAFDDPVMEALRVSISAVAGELSACRAQAGAASPTTEVPP